MPQRVSSRKEPSEEVQGEDSWVELTGMKVKEMKEQQVAAAATRKARKDYQKKLKAHQKLQLTQPDLEDLDDFETDIDALGYGIGKLKVHVLDWNWLDDNGDPLPKPKEDETVFDELTTDEVTFIINKLMGVDESKN